MLYMISQKQVVDKLFDIILSKNKLKYLFLIFILGFFLRAVAANNLAFVADEAIHGLRPIGIIGTGRINAMDQSPLYYYASDFLYKIFGISLLSSRLLSVIFGSFSIIVVFLIGRKLFNENIGLIASFILAVSAFHVRYSLAEMDITMSFLALLSLYCLILFLENSKKWLLLVSSALIGIAFLIKPIALMFLFSYIIFAVLYLYFKKEARDRFLKKEWLKTILAFGLILLIFFMPILSFNYILYKQKGITDVQFSRFLGASKDTYTSIAPTIESWKISTFFKGLENITTGIFLRIEPIAFLLGILGFIMAVRKEKFYNSLIGLWLLVAFVFLTGTSWLHTHFATFVPIFALYSGVALYDIKNKITEKKNVKNLIVYLLLAILLINFFVISDKLFPHLTSQSALGKMRDYSEKNFEPNSIVVADGRIYRGRIGWMFNDKHYLETNYFNQFFAAVDQIPGENITAKIYFVECAHDDCGWGASQVTPINATSEEVVNIFKGLAPVKTVINGGGGYGEESNSPYFIVYETVGRLKTPMFDLADSTHSFYFYPVGWKNDEQSFDYYEPQNAFEVLIDRFSLLVLYLGILLLFASLILPLYFLYRK